MHIWRRAVSLSMIEFKILHRLIRHMIVEIPNVLSHSQLSAVRPVLDQARFVDGKASAGRHARQGKRNLELASDENCIDALNNVVMTQLVQHPLYLAAFFDTSFIKKFEDS